MRKTVAKIFGQWKSGAPLTVTLHSFLYSTVPTLVLLPLYLHNVHECWWSYNSHKRGSADFKKLIFSSVVDPIVLIIISHLTTFLFADRQLSEMVNRLGNLFRSHGIGRGDIVAIYLPVSPMAVATMLACARIGATHSVVFAGFSAQALTSRIQVK